MRFRFSIFVKLLLVIIPLVCIPILVVGYFSIQASEERVNRLVREEQMSQVEAAAHKINLVFYNCRIDLETITRLPVLEDLHLARLFRLEAEAEFNKGNLVKLFRDFLARTPYYYQIRFLDVRGRELVKVRGSGDIPKLADQGGETFFKKAMSLGPKGIFFSDLVHHKDRRGMVMHCAKPFFSGWRERAGVVVIDLDFEKIVQVVRAIRVGQKGYAFMLDNLGRTVVHPRFPPYKYDPSSYPDPSLLKLAQSMMTGSTGWQEYSFQGQSKVAAFAPIPTMNWSLAVTVSMEEFEREAQAIKAKVIQAVLITLLLTMIVVSILSYNLIRPVRRLVAATNRLAGGDLNQEIPVQSHDELGELTLSFNRMVRNLSRIQRELVRSEKLISLGRLSAGVAHEIRNPLNAMKGAMVHLQQRWADEPLIQQYTQLVSEEIDRLNRVVSEFLYFSKQSPPVLEKEDLNRIVLRTQELLAEEAAQRGVRFRNSLDPSLPLVMVDGQQMEQVLLNLIINAMDSISDGGEIHFSTSLDQDNPGHLRLVVEDDGSGISEEFLPYVFDPFFTSKEDGTGLGLPLSLGIVEGHGGSLKLESRQGKGTRVVITLPLKRPGRE